MQRSASVKQGGLASLATRRGVLVTAAVVVSVFKALVSAAEIGASLGTHLVFIVVVCLSETVGWKGGTFHVACGLDLFLWSGGPFLSLHRDPSPLL